MVRNQILAATIAAIVLVAPVGAASHKPAFGGDFTFRKIAPPKPGAHRRITIQIEETAAPEPDAQVAQTDVVPGGGALDWFWEGVSPEIAASKPGRFSLAIDHLSNAPAGKAPPQPRLELLSRIASNHGRDILIQTLDKKVSPALVLALIAVESSGRIDASSGAGAQGLMQLIPATAERFGVVEPNDPTENIKGGVAYLDWLMREFEGDPILALAGYNAGENAVKQHQGVPPFAETRAYVPKVLAAWQVARSLCLTPPDLPTDGCVFRTSG